MARYNPGEVERMYEYMRGEIHKLRECIADLCGLRETVCDDVDFICIDRHPETKEWRVWHEQYADEGSMPLVAVPVPSGAETAPGDDK